MPVDPPQDPSRPLLVPPPGTPALPRRPDEPRPLLVPPPAEPSPSPALGAQPRTAPLGTQSRTPAGTMIALSGAAPQPTPQLGAQSRTPARTILAPPGEPPPQPAPGAQLGARSVARTPAGTVIALPASDAVGSPFTLLGRPYVRTSVGTIVAAPRNTTLVAPAAMDLAVVAADLAAVTHAAPEPGAPLLPDDITEKDVVALQRFAKIRGFFARHGHLLWWAHSAYAITFGAMIMMYASKGYENARWMIVLLGLGWVVLVLFFRLFGTGTSQKDKIRDTKAKVRFYVMTLVLKNLYQSMLFFLLPFYYKSATFDSPNRFFVYVLGLLAILSTVDVVFDQFLMRWKTPASVVYFFILFACLNLVLPALFPDTRTLITLLAAAAVAAVVFFTMQVPVKNFLRPLNILALIVFVATSVAAAYYGRHGIPPVPMYVTDGAVGPSLLPDGRLTMHVSKLHESLIQEMHGLTDILTPGGHGDKLIHIWRHEGVIVQQGPVAPGGDPPMGTVRLRSTLGSLDLPVGITGEWSIDVVTEDDQLVGRVAFKVVR